MGNSVYFSWNDVLIPTAPRQVFSPRVVMRGALILLGIYVLATPGLAAMQMTAQAPQWQANVPLQTHVRPAEQPSVGSLDKARARSATLPRVMERTSRHATQTDMPAWGTPSHPSDGEATNEAFVQDALLRAGRDRAQGQDTPAWLTPAARHPCPHRSARDATEAQCWRM